MEDARPFGDTVLAVEWPLLLECCAPQARPERIRALLHEKPNWKALLTLAEEHGVLAQLDSQLRAAAATGAPLPEEVDALLQKRHREQLMSTLGMTAEMFRVLGNLAAAGVEAIIVKGPVLSVRAYGDPGVRQYADLDFLIRARDLLVATRVLTDCHYESDVPMEAMQAGKIPGEYLFAKPGTRLLMELHTEQTFRYFPRPLPMEDYFARRTAVELDGNAIPALSEEDEFVLICIHGAKHFWERLLWVADVAAMVARCTRLDWEMVRKSARDVGAERMVNVALQLVEDLLRSEIPAAARERMKRDRGAKRVCERIKAWLPYAGDLPPNLFWRAVFRMNMRGGWIAGPAYLLRLSLSPTEEDWVEGAETKRSWVWDAMQRPLRLLKKYGQDGKR
ncbi:MAG TPA: nucleotidyltransferase family protein [Candidatus Acidoferrum sp.]|nr:nucleotidyltransferase family protein [Candidatus Acidoferrum sp.]